MLGWHIIVRKAETQEILTSWVVGLAGIDWLRDLVLEGWAEQTHKGCLPNSFLLKAHHALPFLKARKLPAYGGSVVGGENSVRFPGWRADIEFFDDIIEATHDDDMLNVAAWDDD